MLLIAAPAAVIGIMRFFFVKETVEVKDASEHEGVKLKDVVQVLVKNPYVWMVGFMWFGYSFVTGMGVYTYYFTWALGNIKLMSTASAVSIVALPLLAVFPMLMKKMHKSTLVQIGSILYIISGLILYFCYQSFPAIIVAFILTGIANLPITYFTDLMMLDCGTYNAHVSSKRMDGTIGAIKGFLGKVGGAFGIGMLGWLLQLGNYDGTLSVQPDSAIVMIRALTGLVPVVIFAALALLMMFYKVDSMLPELEKEQGIQ